MSRRIPLKQWFLIRAIYPLKVNSLFGWLIQINCHIEDYDPKLLNTYIELLILWVSAES